MKKRGVYLIILSLLIVCIILSCFKFGPYQTLKYSGYTIIILLEIFTVFFTTYTSVVGYLGLRKKKPVVIREPQKTFAVVVAAHNEEMVIGELVENLNNIDYPKSLYDVYVICDNCIDQTANIVRQKNAIAMERFNETKKGKGYALEWMFERLWQFEEEGKKYDAVVMFDADNLVAKDFLQIMNTKLIEGHELIQGYLGTKNPNDTWITKSYAFAYWATNRVYQLSRENLGLSAQLGGTGVVVTTDILRKMGWGATSLTEDLEFTQRYIIETGKRVVWAHDAKLYDEKPLDFKASWKQRIRWMQGHADCMMRYSPQIFSKFIKTRKLLYFDTLSYLLQPSKVILNLLLLFFAISSFVGSFIYDTGDMSKFFNTSSLILFFGLLIFFNGLTLLGIALETSLKVVLWTPIAYIFSLTWLPISFIGFLKRNERQWDHTKHTRSIKADELEGQQKEVSH